MIGSVQITTPTAYGSHLVDQVFVDVDAPLYRIMPKKHLEQLLQTNTLYFRKVALWDDTWEVPSKFWKSTGKDVSYSKIELANISQKDLYGTCWTDDIDSDAMWRIYS